jgi:hypothetical protein
MTEDASPSPWWLVPQALVWIVTRSESKALQAGHLKTVASFLRMTGLGPASSSEEPPVPLAAAVDELVRAWQARRIALFGREGGKGPARAIPGRNDLGFRDYRGEVCLGEKTLYFDTRPFWMTLSVQADDCKGHWLALEAVNHVGQISRSASARRPRDAEVLALFEEKRRMFRAEGKRAGRDLLLNAAMTRFGLSRKVALEIWNNAPHDRKGGRPKKPKT